jgi:hypothetical protein
MEAHQAHRGEGLLTWKFPNCVEPIFAVAQGAYEVVGDSRFELLQLNFVGDSIVAKIERTWTRGLVGVCPETTPATDAMCRW